MDLIRSLLLDLEAQEEVWKRSIPVIEGYTSQQIAYHLGLLKQAGLIEAIAIANPDEYGPRWLPESLTWEGHEFLEAAREEERWSKAKRIAKEKGGALSFEAVKTALAEMTKRAVILAVATGG